jgi:hypothetical protein
MWYYTQNNQQFGPVDEAKIKELIAGGTINASTMVWSAGMASWQVITQTPLAGLLGSLPPAPPAPPAYKAPVVVDPRTKENNDLFTWYWISLIGILLFGIGLIPAAVLFFILIHKAWKAIQHEGVRATPDQAVAYCMIPGWNFYWYFPAFRGLAKELNEKVDSMGLMTDKINLDMVTWMIICIYASPITFGLSAIAFIVFWIMYTNKVKNILNAIAVA